MNIKQFLKPTKTKIIIFFLLFVAFFVLSASFGLFFSLSFFTLLFFLQINRLLLYVKTGLWAPFENYFEGPFPPLLIPLPPFETSFALAFFVIGVILYPVSCLVAMLFARMKPRSAGESSLIKINFWKTVLVFFFFLTLLPIMPRKDFSILHIGEGQVVFEENFYLFWIFQTPGYIRGVLYFYKEYPQFRNQLLKNAAVNFFLTVAYLVIIPLASYLMAKVYTRRRSK